VYLVPSLDDLRRFHGVIFVRRGTFLFSWVVSKASFCRPLAPPLLARISLTHTPPFVLFCALRTHCHARTRPPGLYTNGIFKFGMRLPPAYNGPDAHPSIVFFSSVYNPHVDPATNELDIKSAYPRWDRKFAALLSLCVGGGGEA
jgi:hypothetical protein